MTGLVGNGKKVLLMAVIDSNGELTGIGRAPRVAIATVEGGKVRSIEEIDVGWGESHEVEQEGLHHANVAKFIRAHSIGAIIAAGAGPDMQRMIEKLGIKLYLASGDFRKALESFAGRV